MKKKLFVCSDIHSYYKELKKALEDARYDENNKDHLLIVLGDIFDRGPLALQTYQYLKRLSDEKKAIVLRGNHDSMFINYLNGETISPFNYFKNGTDETFADFLGRTRPFESWCLIDKNIDYPSAKNFAEWLSESKDEINSEYPELLDWLKNRPYYFETENYIFTHGAIDTKVDDWHNPHCYRYDYIDWEALAWDDGSFFGSSILNTDKTIVIGHFGTEHLRKMYNLPIEKGKEFDILTREDGKVIAIDATTVLSNKVNVLVIDEEDLICSL